MQYTAAKTEAKRRQVPSCSYFKKIYSFVDTHFQIGEMFFWIPEGGLVKSPAANYVTLQVKQRVL